MHHTKRIHGEIWLLAALLVVAGCGDVEIDGLRETDETGGPVVRFQPSARPFPDVPWPSDLLTRTDPSSPTGRRLNLSEIGDSRADAEIRRAFNDRVGWGVYQPITVGFDEPLDIRNIIERHHEPEPEFADDAVYLVNVDEGSPAYGRLRLLDLGRGNYPVTHAESGGFFPNDPRAEGTNLLYETVAEPDLDDDGVFEPREDTDGDGRRDRPNTLDPGGDPLDPDQMLEFYERQTNTLILRPVEPLRPETTYAVVLTKALRGADGNEVQSPFPAVNHTRQTDALEPLRSILSERFPDRFEERLDDVQFAWTFTTGAPVRELRAVRAGLYGHGALSFLEEEYPAELKLLHDARDSETEGPLTFSLDSVIEFVVPLIADQTTSAAADAVKKSLTEIDYLVSGSFMSPYLLSDTDDFAEDGADSTLAGTNPQVSDEHFRIDLEEGIADARPGEVTFTCAIPKPDNGGEQPYPVVLYSHAISSTRLEMLLFAGTFARFGMATCAIDAAGHGLELPADIRENLDSLLEAVGLPGLGTILQHHRARDVRNDGTPDPAGDYFTSDLLHSRSMIRQTAVDQMQFLRILRSFRGERRWPDQIDGDDRYVEARKPYVAGWDQNDDGKGELRGDFNGDGRVDLGGVQGYAAVGTSLGALQTGLLGPLEPSIRVAATNAGGGGLADVASRTTIGHVHNSVLLRLFGPLLVGRPVPGDEKGTTRTRLSFVLPDGSERVRVPIATVEGLEDGDRVVLRNVDRERVDASLVRDGRFRVAVPADALDATARRALLGFDPKNAIQTDVMECFEAETCGENACPGNHYCSESLTCRPLYRCIAEFDPTSLDGDEAKKVLERHTAPTPEKFGDRLEIEIRSSDGTVERRIQSFQFDTLYQNIVYPKGATLAALDSGRGLQRQTPEFRRFISRAHTLLEPADPVAVAPHYVERPFEFPYEREAYRDGTTQVLAIGTVGDQTVPIDTGIAFARAAGLVGTRSEHPSYGKTANQFLIDNFVYEGIAELDRFPTHPGALFDPDDLDRGMFVDPDDPMNMDPNPDADRPLRATVQTKNGASGLRLPYLEIEGAHTFNAPRPDAPFDVPSLMTNQVAWYFATGGAEIRDDACLQERPPTACSFYDPETYAGSGLSRTD